MTSRKYVAFLALAASLAPQAIQAYDVDSDVPPAVAQQLADDLVFIGTIQADLASALHTQIFGKVDGPTYLGFFNSRVKHVGLSDCGSPKAVACVNTLQPTKMWLTQNFIQFDHPQIARMMVVFHESRHTEWLHGSWPHANSPSPFLDAGGQPITSSWTGADLAGEPACDTTALGSYGSSLIMLKNISKYCKNCGDKVMMDAGIYSDDQFKRITGQSAHDQIEQDLYR
jgi:hypothetical protein